MSEWKECRLGAVCTKIGSGATPTGGQESYKCDGVSLVRSQNILDFKFSYDGLAHIDEEQAAQLNNVTLQERDVLINITGDSVARVCQVPNNILPARVNQHVSIIRTDEKNVHSNYMLYLLLSLKEHLLSISEIGATRRAITKAMLDNLEIKLPSIHEQKAIAEILSGLDGKIDLLNRQNKTLEDLAQTYFKQWFIEGEHEEFIAISDIAILDNEGVNPSKKPLELFYHYSIPAFDNEQQPTQELGQAILSNKFKVKPRTILVSKLNPATPRIWNIGEAVLENSVCSTEFQVLKPNDNKYQLFLYFLMKSYNVVSYFSMCTTGTSGSHQRIKPEYILQVEIGKPNEQKLQAYNDIFDDVMLKVQENMKQIQTLQKLRDTLLPKLISGEIRVKGV